MASVTELKLHGLPAVRLTYEGATCDVLVYGAHLTSWITGGRENLFVSSKAEYGNGKAVRGGVPICWPQFAAKGPYTKHGFCRNSAEWTVVRTSTEPCTRSLSLSLSPTPRLAPSSASRSVPLHCRAACQLRWPRARVHPTPSP